MALTTLQMSRYHTPEDRRQERRREDDRPPSGPNWSQILAGIVVLLITGWLTATWTKADRVDSTVNTHLQYAAGKAAEFEQVKKDVAEIKAMLREKTDLEKANAERLERIEAAVRRR